MPAQEDTGPRVAIRDTPYVGTVVDSFWRHDWATTAFVVEFENVGPSEPPGGEFPFWRLVRMKAAS
jgi:hypothetical protein